MLDFGFGHSAAPMKDGEPIGACKNRDAIPAPDPFLIKAAHNELGLVLELTKSSVDVLVIDHVQQKPAKN
jgi:uncharacterized protein (TIGR03435 family)